MGERCAEAQLLVTTVYCNIVHLSDWCSTHQLVLPVVCGGSLVNVHIGWVTKVGTECVVVILVIIRQVALISYKLVRVEHLLLTCQVLQLAVGVEFNLYLTLLGRLGGNNYYTITASCTIDSGERSVLQYVDRLNVGWWDIVDVILLESIYNIQRLVVLSKGSTTTDFDVDVGTWCTIHGTYLYTGNLTLKGLTC